MGLLPCGVGFRTENCLLCSVERRVLYGVQPVVRLLAETLEHGVCSSRGVGIRDHVVEVVVISSVVALDGCRGIESGLVEQSGGRERVCRAVDVGIVCLESFLVPHDRVSIHAVLALDLRHVGRESGVVPHVQSRRGSAGGTLDRRNSTLIVNFVDNNKTRVVAVRVLHFCGVPAVVGERSRCRRVVLQPVVQIFYELVESRDAFGAGICSYDYGSRAAYRTLLHHHRNGRSERERQAGNLEQPAVRERDAGVLVLVEDGGLRALSDSNYAHELPAFRDACRRHGLASDEVHITVRVRIYRVADLAMRLTHLDVRAAARGKKYVPEAGLVPVLRVPLASRLDGGRALVQLAVRADDHLADGVGRGRAERLRDVVRLGGHAVGGDRVERALGRLGVELERGDVDGLMTGNFLVYCHNCYLFVCQVQVSARLIVKLLFPYPPRLPRRTGSAISNIGTRRGSS